MAEGGPSILVKRPIRVAGKQAAAMVDHPIERWNDNKKVMYKRDGVYMVLGGRVTQCLRENVCAMVISWFVTQGPTPEQGLVDYLFRGAYTLGLDSSFFKLCWVNETNPRTRTSEPRSWAGSLGLRRESGQSGQPPSLACSSTMPSLMGRN
jgi:hypothetical protein